MFRQLITGAAVIGVVTALTVAPAQAASFEVTLKTDSAKADVNKTFRLSGKVTGAGAGNKKILIERKVGSADWKSFSTVVTRPTGTYAKTFTVKSVGAKQYRVLVPKTSKLTTGTSNKVTVTGFTWLNLVDQPTTAQGSNVNVTRKVEGKTYKKSVAVFESYGAIWNLGQRCDKVKAGVTIDPLASSGAADQVIKADTIENGIVKKAKAKDKQYTSIVATVTGVTGFAFANVEGDSDVVFDVLTPQAHCSATSLPEYLETGPTD